MKITLSAIIIIPIALYICFGIYLYVVQKSKIYFPSDVDFYECNGFDDYEKLILNGTRFYFKEKTDKVIVYYHGNSGRACDNTYLKSVLDNNDYSIIFVEYAGYAKDKYSPSISLLLNDVTNVSYFVKMKNFKQVVVYGRSLGTGLASYHASIGNVDKLILVTPFDTFVNLVKSTYPIYPIKYILTEKYDNLTWLKDYKNELLIIHGDQDKVIPMKFGKNLFDSLSTPKKSFETIIGKGHNDIDSNILFYDKINEFLKK